MSEQYKPIPFKYTPASIPQIVAHIQKWLLDHPYVTEEDVIEIITTALEEHPEYINGSNIPISSDDPESIKSYIDSLPALDAYTKSETDTLLSGKEDTLTFDSTPTAGSTNPVTSEGIKTALDNAASAVNDALALKADKSDTYTKTQVDNALLLKADADNVYSKNTIDAKFEALDLDVDAIDSAIERMDGEIDDIRENLYMISPDGNAPANMPAGDYVELNGNLYMLTADVSTGDLLIPGTNCVQILGGGLNRLGAGLKTQAQTINGLTAELSGAEDAIAVVINGNTNTTGGAIAAGTYLFIKNHSTLPTGAYHATAAISSGESVTSSNTAADSDGIANALNAKMNTSSVQIGAGCKVYKTGNVVMFNIDAYTFTSDGSNNITDKDGIALVVPSGYRPGMDIRIKDPNENKMIRIDTTGKVYSNDVFTSAAIRPLITWII